MSNSNEQGCYETVTDVVRELNTIIQHSPIPYSVACKLGSIVWELAREERNAYQR
jgi:hypothetical protein